jgi:hypothetical protein
MAAKAILDIYQQHVKPLPAEQQLELLALIANGLAAHGAPRSKRRPLTIPEFHGAARASADRGKDGEPLHDIMEFRGAGRDSWDGTDAQEFVSKLRAEWDHRP